MKSLSVLLILAINLFDFGSSQSFNDAVCTPFIGVNPEASCTCLESTTSLRCTYSKECLPQGVGFESIFGHSCPGDTCVTISKQYSFAATMAENSVSYEYESEETISEFESNSVDYTSIRFSESKMSCEMHFMWADTEFKCKSCQKESSCTPGTFIMDCSNIQEGAVTTTCSKPTIFSLCPRGGAPEPMAITNDAAPSAFCFPGNAQVEVQIEHQEGYAIIVKSMAELAIGDLVQVASSRGHKRYEPIYSFGHYNKDASAEFYQIVFQDKGKPSLEISRDHMVFLVGNDMGQHAVPASMIRPVDKLVSIATADSAGDEVSTVTSINLVNRDGIFAPFTASGTIVVDNIVASTYIAYQGSECLQIAGWNTLLSYQWLAHKFQSAHRIAISLGIGKDTYSDTGVSHWVDKPHKAGSWLLDQHAVVVVVLLIPAIFLFGFLSLIESIFIWMRPLLK